MNPISNSLLILQYIECNENDMNDDVELRLEQFQGVLSNPFQIKSNPPNAEERNDILSCKVFIYTCDGVKVEVKLSQEQVEGILKLSSKLSLSEKECLRLWRCASQTENRRLAENFSKLPTKTLDGNIAQAAEIIFRMEKRTMLDALLELLKHRNSTTTKKHILGYTNKLLQNHLFSNLVHSIKSSLQDLKNFKSTSNGGSNSIACSIDTHVSDDIFVMVQCLFFITYSTQLNEEELVKFSDLLLLLSNDIIEKKSASSMHISSTLPSIFDPSTQTLDTINRSQYVNYLNEIDGWKRCGMIVLIVLQLALHNTLSQGIAKLDRNKNVAPYTRSDEKNELSFSIVKKHFHANSASWHSKGAHGLIYLMLAIHGQPAVDNGEINSQEIIAYLKEASTLRGYSYIRLCVLPILEHFLSDVYTINSQAVSSTTSLITFLTDTLHELMVELARLYAVYKDMNLYVNCNNIQQSRESSPTVDCLDDIMHTYSVACNRLVSLPLIMANDGKGGSHPYQYHPFFVRCIELSWKDPYLMIAAIRLLGSVGRFVWAVPETLRDRIGSNSMAIFHYMKENSGPKQSMSIWNFLLGECIDVFAHQLGGVNATTKENTSLVNKLPTVAPEKVLLSDIDRDYLIAIADTINYMGRCPEVATMLQTEYNIISHLFPLLACPIPIFLKGSLYKAVASLAYGSPRCTFEAWTQLELYDLLGFSSYSSNNLPIHKTSVNRGLRFELESTESTAGVYPCTESFLNLVESMLVHGIPNQLGLGYRIPGIAIYLEYIIDDIFSRVHLRKYAPNTYTGQSQKWRITARVIHILSIIIQHYNINFKQFSADMVTGGDQNNHNYPQLDALCDTNPELDFQATNPTVFKIRKDDGTIADQKAPRLKSAGFTVMAMLLSGTSNQPMLLSHILTILQGCDLKIIRQSSIDMLNHAVEGVISVTSVMQPPVNPPVIYGLDEDLSTIGLSLDSLTNCNGSYWQEKTVTACIGLIYECCLRATAFTKACRRCDTPLTFIRLDRGKSVSVTVIPQNIVDILSSGIHLSKIANFLSLTSTQSMCISIPTVPFMTANILEYIATQQQSHLFLGSMSIADFDDKKAVIMACVQCLCEPAETQLHLVMQSDLGKLAYDNGTLYFYTPTRYASLKPPLKPTEALRLLFNQHDLSLSEESGGILTIKETILNLLLTSLSPSSLCMSHMLLGLHDSIDKLLNSHSDPIQEAALLPDRKFGEASNCLEALIEVICPINYTHSSNIIFAEPNIALLCFELIYRLCTYPMTSALVLTYLRKPSVNFLSIQMKQFLYSFTISYEDLETFVTRQQQHLPSKQSIDARVQEIKMVQHHCLGWLLQIFALELRLIETSSDYSTTKIQNILEILYLHKDPVDFDLVDSSISPLTHLLVSAFDFPPSNFPSVTSKIVLQLLDDSTQPYVVGGGEGNGLESSMFSIIDTQILSRFLLSRQQNMTRIQIEEAVEAAISMNIYQQRMAALTHCTRAWSQLIDITLIGKTGDQLFNNFGLNIHDAIRQFNDVILIPALSTLVNSTQLEMIMAERLMLSITMMISTITRLSPDTPIATSQILNNRSTSVNISQEQITAILTLLLELLTGNAKSSGFSSFKQSKSTSLYFRGLICTSLTTLLSTGHEPSFPVASTATNSNSLSSEGNANNSSIIAGADAERQRSNLQTFQRVLLPFAVPATAVMGDDACSGPLVWRLATLSALQAILFTLGHVYSSPTQSGQELGPEDVRYNDSLYDPQQTLLQQKIHHTYHKCIRALFQRDYIQNLLQSSLGNLNTVTVTNSTGYNLRKCELDQGLYEGLLSLFINISRTSECAEELIKLGLLNYLVALNRFDTPPDMIDENVAADSSSSNSQSPHNSFQSQLLPTLNLLQLLATNSPTRTNLEKCLLFVLKNHLTITHFIRLRTRTMSGFTITQAVIQVFTCIVKPPRSDSTINANTASLIVSSGASTTLSGPSTSSPLFDSVLGQHAESFTADILRLLHRLGVNPAQLSEQPHIPVLHSPESNGFIWETYGGTQRSASSWWDQIQPMAGTEDEYLNSITLDKISMQDNSTSNIFVRGNGSYSLWTAFKERKRQIALDIICHSSCFIRQRCVYISELRGLNSANNQSYVPLQRPVKLPRVSNTVSVPLSSANNQSQILGLVSLLSVDFDQVTSMFTSSINILLRLQQYNPDLNIFERGIKFNINNSSAIFLPLQTPKLQAPNAAISQRVSSLPSKSYYKSSKETEIDTLLYTVENLICVIHVLVSAAVTSGDSRQLEAWRKPLETFVKLTNLWPSHTFTRQVARWVIDKLEQ